ncbi:sigma-70 family RNA polymerase sigma factor [Nonomuraea fuscirosea]|jgi:RNA polymerase sigma factor (sigma-70 family)|uniref:sigma-70 family RNA polymerase sigma factor n=1 Tax=Nonomuraea fuscirosea TaxID=1291556 RepID=UPI002DD7D08C|nr:sigma-70 family RNA polymerase sigma factor [Nonomuraea fuscirosea]WSA52739.1 sigma-70 family RNA polymerase sigma factor [Nonomuraea fuscirosea]
MDEQQWLADRFAEHRSHLRAVAFRMLGSLSEADDALQDAWLRASRADVGQVDNLIGWLTTIVARVCLNMLRSRGQRRDEPLDIQTADPLLGPASAGDPEHEVVMADSVGVALLVVLDTLSPAERLAFVLHDLFAVPFEEIAPMLERSPEATRQLASRARRRVRGAAPAPHADLTRRRKIVEAFLSATRGQDFRALITLLHPEVTLRADRAVMLTAEPVMVAGAEPVAKGAMAAMRRARFTGPALLDGAVGLVMAPYGRLRVALAFTIADDLITAIDVIAEPDRLDRLQLAVLD